MSDSKGLILIEAVISLAFAGFALLALTMMFSSGLDSYLHSRNYTQALYLAESKIEETTIFPYSTLSSKNSAVEKIHGMSFTWIRTIQPVEPKSTLQQIEVTVKWLEPSGRHQAKLITQGIIKP